MLPTLFSLLIAPALAPVSVGPDQIHEAPTAPLALRRVTVFSGRSRVERAGSLRLTAGAHVLRLPLLPGRVSSESVRVQADGARVLHVSSRLVEGLRPTLDQAEASLSSLEALRRKQTELQTRRVVLERHAARIEAIRPVLPSSERPPGRILALNPQGWRSVLSDLATELNAAREQRRAVDAELLRVAEELSRVEAQVSRLEQAGFVTRGLQVGVVLFVPTAGMIKLRAEYLTEGPNWSPRYRVVYLPERSAVKVELHAEVRQSTGEDYRGADLAFSTARPGRHLNVPELPSWLLGEREDLVLVPRRADTRPPAAAAAPWPPPVATRATEAQSVRLHRYRERRLPFGALQFDIGEALARRPEPPPVVSPEPAPTTEDDEESFEAEARLLSDVVVTGAIEESRRTRRPSVQKYRSTALALFEAAGPTGGRDLNVVYEAEGQVPIPSGGESVRVPLTSYEVKVAPYHRVSPSLDGAGYLRAEVRNPSDRPWLAGPAGLFIGAEPVGTVQLSSVGPGGRLALPLGRDERIRVARRVESTARSTGFLGGRRKERFAVTIDVASHLDVETTVEVLEPVPVHVRGNMNLALEAVEPEPVALHSKDLQNGLPRSGLLRWKIRLRPKEKRSLSLVYSLEHGSDERAYQE